MSKQTGKAKHRKQHIKFLEGSLAAALQKLKEKTEDAKNESTTSKI